MSLLRPVLALALVPFAGCVVVVDGPGEFNADLVVSEHCGTVAIQLDAGDVSVVRADVADVQISWGSTGIADAPSVSATVDEDGVLWLTGDCSQGLSCGVDVALLVPSGVSLDVQTGSGDVVLSVPLGAYDLDLATGSGDLVLIGITPDETADAHLAVTTSSGDVVVSGF